MKDIISSCIDLTHDEYQAFNAIARIKKTPKNYLLIHSGAVANKIFFLESGAVRAYRHVDGVDYTHFFFIDRWFITDLKSFLNDKPSDLYIETLTDTVCYEFHKNDMDELSIAFPKFEKLWKIIAERAYLFSVERLENMQTKNLRERYYDLLEQSPTLFMSFPQKHIASYLGVSEQSLSRIKKR